MNSLTESVAMEMINKRANFRYSNETLRIVRTILRDESELLRPEFISKGPTMIDAFGDIRPLPRKMRTSSDHDVQHHVIEEVSPSVARSNDGWKTLLEACGWIVLVLLVLAYFIWR